MPDATMWMLIAILVIQIFSISRQERQTTARLWRLEEKLDAIARALEIQPPAAAEEQVAALVRAGRKIEAIKRYREQTGVGLKEAKDYVDSL